LLLAMVAVGTLLGVAGTVVSMRRIPTAAPVGTTASDGAVASGGTAVSGGAAAPAGTAKAAGIAAPGGTVAPGGTAVLAGQIVNALDNHPVPNAEVRVAGTKLSAHTDSQGRYRLAGIPAGQVPLEISAAGYTSEQFQRVLTAGKENSLREAINPGMKAGQIRIVLTWGEEPKDLDAHLEGPLPDGQRFHVYYHHPGDLKSREFVRLDVDAQNGEGPETITVLGVLPGRYQYWVHDYTHRDEPKSTALAQSEAEVKIYQGSQTYRYHAGHDMVGNRWDVCTIDVAPEGAAVKKIDTYQNTSLQSLGLYAKRTMAGRSEWIAESGGSTQSETTVDDGLNWLARHQGEKGGWSRELLGGGEKSRCEKPLACSDADNVVHCPFAHSGLALLAFQAGGHYYFNNNTYSKTVRRGLDWLVANQASDGALFNAKASRKRNNPEGFSQPSMYEHGIAAFALADACAAARESGQAPDARYLHAAAKAARFIEEVQHRDGGWRYNDRVKEPSDTSVTGWQVLALKSAREAGIAIPAPCVEQVRRYFNEREMGVDGRTDYLQPNTGTDAMTGVGMLARQFLLNEPHAPLIGEAANYLARRAQQQWGNAAGATAGTDYYLWYNCTLAMYQAGGKPWEQWNPIIRDTLVRLQRHDGCERGSWDPDSGRGSKGGRILSTALAILTLETYYRYAAPAERGAAPGTARLTARRPGGTIRVGPHEPGEDRPEQPQGEPVPQKPGPGLKILPAQGTQEGPSLAARRPDAGKPAAPPGTPAKKP
jgi:uncharacterized protein YfaP (DUF2135 family)